MAAHTPQEGRTLRQPRPTTRREPWLAFLFGALVMTYIQSASYEPSGRDSFYHIKMAVLLPEIGFPEHFHWLRHTIHNDQHVSHHHGFHIMLVPFVYASKWLADSMPASLKDWAETPGRPPWIEPFKIGLRGWFDSPYILGAKVLNILLFGLVVLSCALILRSLDVGFRWFWILCVAALPTDFFFRMSFIRAPIASLALLLMVCYACIQRRHILVGILGAVYCHLYAGAVFYPLVVAVYCVVQVVLRKNWRLYVPIAAAALIGFVVGLVTHPYFPQNIGFLKVQILESGLQLFTAQKVRVGTEWYAYKLKDFCQMSAFVLILLGLTVTYRLTGRSLRNPSVLFLAVLNLVFLGFCLHAQRFIEYWPVFCLLSCAVLWGDLEVRLSSHIPNLSIINIDFIIRRTGTAVVVITLLAAAATLEQSRKYARTKFDIPTVKAAMAYLRESTPQSSLVFADDWDVFPVYFFYNHHNDYVCGLDPQFTNSKYPVLWERYCVITQGRAPKKSSVQLRSGRTGGTFEVRMEDIREHFGADYVIVDKDHKKFYKKLRSMPEDFAYVFPPRKGDKAPTKQPSLAIFRVLDPASPEATEGPALQG